MYETVTKKSMHEKEIFEMNKFGHWIIDAWCPIIGGKFYNMIQNPNYGI